MIRYYDRDGKAIPDVRDWAKLMQDPSFKIVKQERLWNGVWLSTVWLGLNHAWGDGPPQIFETMPFWMRVSEFGELGCTRYSTEAEARAGHEVARRHYSSLRNTLRHLLGVAREALGRWWWPFTYVTFNPTKYTTWSRGTQWLRELWALYGGPTPRLTGYEKIKRGLD